MPSEYSNEEVRGDYIRFETRKNRERERLKNLLFLVHQQESCVLGIVVRAQLSAELLRRRPESQQPLDGAGTERKRERDRDRERERDDLTLYSFQILRDYSVQSLEDLRRLPTFSTISLFKSDEPTSEVDTAVEFQVSLVAMVWH